MPFIHHINTKEQELTTYQTKQNIADFFRYAKDMTSPSTIDIDIIKGAFQVCYSLHISPF